MNAKLVRTVVFLVLGLVPTTAGADEPLLTVAEKSDFRATSRHADVVAFCQRLAQKSPVVRLGELGTTSEGRKLPLLILADPPVSTPEEAARTGKLVVYAQGNIHAGEVDGKEGLMMLARDIAMGDGRPLLKDLVVVIAPIFNADGNERMARTNRPGQVGPEEGMGVRFNAQGLDLNRDFVKLESPEVRALVRFVNRWDPAVLVDTHTTNGSHHRYTITYEGPRHPACDPKLVHYVNDVLFPDVGQRLERRGGYKSFFYGNFSRDHSRWETVPATPRYGIHYFGLRHRIAILSESYSYAPYRDRVLASRDFVRCILDFSAANRAAIHDLVTQGRAPTAVAGRQPGASDQIGLRSKAVPVPTRVTLLGYVEDQQGGRRVATDRPKDYEVEYLGRCEPTLQIRRPYAYLIAPSQATAIENLQRHGLAVDELREDIELDVDVYRVDQVERAPRPFQKHQLVTLQVTPRAEPRRIPAGTVLVRTDQALGTLAAFLLEPQSEDGLATWNFFDEALQEGKDYPVLRLASPTPITSGPVRPLPEDRTMNRPVTEEAVFGADAQLRGRPVPGIVWLDDEHFLQSKGGQQLKVDALTGRSMPYQRPHDAEKVAKALSTLPTIGSKQAQSLADRLVARADAKAAGTFFDHDNDLYYARLDGTQAVRLTKTPGPKELPSMSPDGKFIAFVRANNLYVVDVATQTERVLTTDGSPVVLNGKADWVYYEEIFNRNYRAYWWSPDSTKLVFLRFDDTPVYKFTVIDQIPGRQDVEATPWPRAGDPNPVVKVGIVSAAGGPVRFADLSGYSETSSLVIRAGWMPASDRAYFYAQDRAQTWLDFCTVPATGGKITRLFRDATKAWIEDPGEPRFLKDGSFLLFSERSGFKHIYRYDKDGKLQNQVTSGNWEARSIQRVDEAGGWVYFSGMRDSPIASNFYRVKLDGTGLERLTKKAGDHRASLNPGNTLFIDTWSNHATPTQLCVCKTDGSVVRTLDTNPVYEREEFRLGRFEMVQIPTPDGFMLEGSLSQPPDFDANKRYPVWFMTYGGPHTPTVHDSWGASLRDQAMTKMGFIVFRCDPRSASGKGAVSTWTAYRQLGVQELKDVETAINWLKEKPYVDGTRIGMSGHSYGGFLTAFCLTHSKLFAAGIAGAPVTDWRNYDTIYTERYMNTPQENPGGYDATSVVKAAGQLHGKLLILHGMMDDNVHLQNTAQLLDGLQAADKDFEVMFYPRARHGIFGRHYQRLVNDFMKRHLLDKPKAQ